jgi:hypothetical protein
MIGGILAVEANCLLARAHSLVPLLQRVVHMACENLGLCDIGTTLWKRIEHSERFIGFATLQQLVGMGNRLRGIC